MIEQLKKLHWTRNDMCNKLQKNVTFYCTNWYVIIHDSYLLISRFINVWKFKHDHSLKKVKMKMKVWMKIWIKIKINEKMKT